ncbi:actin depolymerizing protein, partial [Yamadazyma tenuis ATCC 10573]
MEKIDLSTNARNIENAYLKVVRNQGINYLILKVDNSAVVDLEETGQGDLNEFVEHFTDGHVQFGLARVNVPGSDVYKNLLLGWCPANARAKARLSFASNFADIANVLVGYHVQITARDQDDLDVNEFLSRVSAAAGARYSIQSLSSSAKPITSKPISSKAVEPIVPKPAPTPAKSLAPTKPAAPKPAFKPAFVPKSTGNPINVSETPIIKPKPVVSVPKPSVADEDDWGDAEDVEERDFDENPLQNTPSAYKPTKVNITELRKQKSDTISSQPTAVKPADDKPEDGESPHSFKDRMSAYKKNEEPSDGRLTSLPKPKTNHAVSSRFTPVASGPSFGSKPSFIKPVENKTDKLVTGVNRDFASENGKTPA